MQSITSLVAAWAAIMEALGNAVHRRSAHAYGPTPPRRRCRVTPLQRTRLRKVKRLEPAVWMLGIGAAAASHYHASRTVRA